MKKHIYSAIAMFAVTLCSAQVSLSQAEYFWGNDPGEGNGTAITATDGSFNSAFEKIAVTGLGAPGAGLHKFSVRVKDNQNEWSPAFTRVIKVEPTTTPTPVSLLQAEYFWDADPGEGNGTALASTDGSFNSTFEQVGVSGLNAPSSGKHKFSVRVKDNQGVWSPAFTTVVNVADDTTPTPVTLVQGEYFWDADPGEGAGTPIVAADGNFDAAFENFLKEGIQLVGPIGKHVFNVRVKDSEDLWSPLFKNVVYIETVVMSVDVPKAGVEYYFYPNPATTTIQFSKQIARVDIYDINGRFVGTSQNTTQVNIENLAAGTYVLQVTTEEGTNFTKKMIKKQ